MTFGGEPVASETSGLIRLLFPSAALLTLFALYLPLSPSQANSQVVRGHVLESGTRRPVGLARVLLLDTLGLIQARDESDVDGSFTLMAPGPGTYLIGVDRLGYRGKIDGAIELGEGGFLQVDFFLVAAPIEIEGIVAEAERRRVNAFLENQGFYRRKKAQAGWFMTPEEIAEEPLFDTADLIRTAPFVERVDRFGRGASIVMWGRGRYGRCTPSVMVDALPLPPGVDINDFVLPEDVLALEVYRGVAQIPLEWGGFESCGVILLWTRWGSMLHK